jgi:hypothetical protein
VLIVVRVISFTSVLESGASAFATRWFRRYGGTGMT